MSFLRFFGRGGVPWRKRWAIATVITMMLSSVGGVPIRSDRKGTGGPGRIGVRDRRRRPAVHLRTDPRRPGPRGSGIPGDNICNIGNWAEVKAQASTKLGIRLTDADVFDVPLTLTDPYGYFKPGPNGFPQLVRPATCSSRGT